MMTQPIRTFEGLTSETASAGGNDLTKFNLSFDERRLLELRARYARAEMLADHLGDFFLWVGRQYRRVVNAIKNDFKLRAAEAQLFRMSDRELADLGLCRSDIPFAVREAGHGVAPHFDAPMARAGAANENLRRAA